MWNELYRTERTSVIRSRWNNIEADSIHFPLFLMRSIKNIEVSQGGGVAGNLQASLLAKQVEMVSYDEV